MAADRFAGLWRGRSIAHVKPHCVQDGLTCAAGVVTVDAARLRYDCPQFLIAFDPGDSALISVVPPAAAAAALQRRIRTIGADVAADGAAAARFDAAWPTASFPPT